MAHIIKVHVQLPNGSFAYLPVARWKVGWQAELVKEETEKDAREWAMYTLHERVRVEEE